MTNETITTDTQNTFYQTVNELEEAMKTQNLYSEYITLDETWKKRFADYMTGKKTMPLTYDPFFKCMFHPDRHPDWLSNLLSAILGESVVVERLLPSENTAISIDSLLIMDIVVRLSNGSLANVEIQKIPYMLVVGGKEEENEAVSVRSRFKGDEGQMKLDDFLDAIKEEIANRENRKVEKED